MTTKQLVDSLRISANSDDADFVRRYDRMLALSDPRLRPLSEDDCNELASLIFYVRTEADRRLCSAGMAHPVKLATR